MKFQFISVFKIDAVKLLCKYTDRVGVHLFFFDIQDSVSWDFIFVNLLLLCLHS